MTKVGPFTHMVAFGIREIVVVPQSKNLREEIVKEFHYSRFAIYLGGSKMYHDLHRQCYWSGMKQ